MIESEPAVRQFELILVFVATGMAMGMILAVVVARLAIGAHERWTLRLQATYAPIVRRAFEGDAAAVRALVDSPARHHLTIAKLVVRPLIADRQPPHVAAARTIIRDMSLLPFADRLLHSRRWTRRAVGIRAMGLLQNTDYTARIVAALDDTNFEVRNAAFDALADMQDFSAVQAVVVRMHDTTLHRGRRAAALAAFGPTSESFLLDLGNVDPSNRFNYAYALGICGTARSRPRLCEWATDTRPGVAAAALEALARIGVDEPAAHVAMAALESPAASVRAMAARALRGWTGGGAAVRLARHLDDEWPVAIEAARALQSIDGAGHAELESRSRQQDLAGELARQMLWKVGAAS